MNQRVSHSYPGLRYVLPLLGAVLVGFYLLYGERATFLPYQPAPSLDFLVFSDPSSNISGFLEAEQEARRLQRLADRKLGLGNYGPALDALTVATQTYTHVGGLYERMADVHAARGEWKSAVQAMDAELMQAPVLVMTARGHLEAEGIPDGRDITAQAGLDECRHGAGGESELNRISPGVAVFDLDGDGWPEVVCLGGAHAPTRVYQGQPGGFREVRNTGLEETLMSQGVYVVDVTGNGRPDIVVTAIGESRLYLNEGDLRFRSLALPLPEMWGSAVAAADVTGNGHMDLVVGGWLRANPFATSPDGVLYDFSDAEQGLRMLPNPDAKVPLAGMRYGTPLHLLEGDGKGGFVDITAASGLEVNATTLNLELIDVSGDGNLDLVVINDSMPARLLLGDGKGNFADVTHSARFGDVRAGMGLAVADFDGDGHWDFVKTHFQGEMNGAFMSDGFRGNVPVFRDAAMENGLGVPSLPYVGWAAFAWDFNASGEEDLFTVNGHISHTPQSVQLFQNRHGRFRDVSGALPAVLRRPLMGRGAAMFDFTGNGYDDILIAQHDGPLRLFALQPTHGHHWIRVRVRVPDLDALGGVVELVDERGRIQRRPVRTGSAYFSSQPRDVFFGLGKGRPETLTWKGRVSTVECPDLEPGTVVTITEDGCESVKVGSW